MLAVLAPGQGSQRAGCLSSWLEMPHSGDLLDRAAEVTGLNVAAAGTDMSETDITDTRVAQPLIVTASLIAVRSLPHLDDTAVTVGHSVGELAAVAVAGFLTDSEALRLVAARGNAMAAAAEREPGTMVAILGGDEATVIAAVTAAGCEVANYNTSGQLVAAGPVAAVQRLAANPPTGSRIRPLAVAGAFHTQLMASAVPAVADVAAALTPRPARLGWLSNTDGQLVDDPAEVLERLVAQIRRPVRWDRCVDTLRSLGVTGTVELAPAGTLTAMIRRALPNVEAVAIRTPDDLTDASRVIQEHTTPLTDTPPPWRLVVAPTRGHVRVPQPAREQLVVTGEQIAQVATRGDDVPVLAEADGCVIEWLVRDGDPVMAGQPVARLAGASGR